MEFRFWKQIYVDNNHVPFLSSENHSSNSPIISWPLRQLDTLKGGRSDTHSYPFISTFSLGSPGFGSLATWQTEFLLLLSSGNEPSAVFPFFLALQGQLLPMHADGLSEEPDHGIKLSRKTSIRF
jgi:hypothetical protein